MSRIVGTRTLVLRWRLQSLTLALLLVISAATVPAGVAAAPTALPELSATINFGSSLVYQLAVPWTGPAPASVAVRFGLPDGLVTNRAAAEFEVTQGVLRASHRWALRGSLVPGANVEYGFVIQLADGRQILTATETVTYMDPSLAWVRAREGLIEIWYYDGGPELEAQARSAIRRGLGILRDEFEIELRRPTRLVLYADVQRMQQALGGGTSPWVGGAAIAEFNVTVLHAAAETRFRRDIEAVIAHELTHIVIEHATENPYGGLPAWLHEGLATTVESSIFERFPYADIMELAVASGEFVSLRGITGGFPANGRRAVQAYAQSNSLVGYIIDRWGTAAVTRLLAAYAQGVTDNDAVRAALDVSLGELERAWLAVYGVESPSFAALTEAGGPPPAQVERDGPAGPRAPTPAPSLSLIVGAAIAAVAITLVIVSGRLRPRGRVSRP